MFFWTTASPKRIDTHGKHREDIAQFSLLFWDVDSERK
jgi:hypothetical protein